MKNFFFVSLIDAQLHERAAELLELLWTSGLLNNEQIEDASRE